MQVFGGLSTSLLPGCQHQNFAREESADVRYSGLHLCHHCQHSQVFGNHRKSNFWAKNERVKWVEFFFSGTLWWKGNSQVSGDGPQVTSYLHLVVYHQLHLPSTFDHHRWTILRIECAQLQNLQVSWKHISYVAYVLRPSWGKNQLFIHIF